jgi:nucleoside-diphosphate-sugar epimerase
VVIHLAAAGVDPRRNDPHEIFETNVLGFLNLLTSAEAAGAERVAGAGSCFEYDATSDKPLAESDPLLPLTPYAASKSSAVMLASAFAKTRDLKVVMLRPFTAYGPYERPDRLIPHVILSAMRRAPIRLTGGEQTRDFVYVEDAAEAFLVAGLPGAPSGEVFNVGTGRATAVLAVARRILDLMQSEATIEVGALPYRPAEYWHLCADISRSRERLHWSPRVDLDDGLSRTIEWMRSSPDMVREQGGQVG